MTREQRETRDTLRREVKRALRDSDRATLQRLRAELKAMRERRRAAMRQAVTVCRARRRDLASYRKQRRAEVRAELSAEFEALKLAARRNCAKRKERVRRSGGALEGRAKAALAAERRLQAELLRIETRRKKRETRATTRRRESDDEVAQNLPEELVPVFRRVRRSITAPPGMSRTEAFLHWAEEHPGDVVTMQADAAERDVARLLREQAAAERRAKTKPRPTRASLRERLAVELGALGAKRPQAVAARLAKGHDVPEVRALLKGAPRKVPAVELALRRVDELKAVPF